MTSPVLSDQDIAAVVAVAHRVREGKEPHVPVGLLVNSLANVVIVLSELLKGESHGTGVRIT